MRVMGEGLSPSVQNGNHAALGAEVAWISTDEPNRLRRRLEQDVVDDRLVLQGDGSDRLRHGEDDVEIRHRKQVGAAIGDPLGARQALALRAVPVATAIVGDANEATVIALLDMAAERCGATDLDGGHDAALVGREPTALRGPERLAVAAEDIRHLQRRAHGSQLLGRDHLEREPIEWARRPGDQAGGDLGVTGGRFQLAVAEHHLDDANVGPALQQVGGKAVPQRVGGRPLADPRPLPRGAAGRLESSGADMTARFLARKQPQAGSRPLPIGTENVAEARRQHRVPVAAALATLDVEQHPLAVDRADLQPCHLADAQARRVCSRQRYAIAQSCNRFQKAHDLLGAENRRKLLRLLANDDPLQRLLVAEGDAVELCGVPRYVAHARQAFLWSTEARFLRHIFWCG
jgi:hypothetical protein